MKLYLDNNTYLPVYKASADDPDYEYNELIRIFESSYHVTFNSFQSMYDALVSHIFYWENESDHYESYVDESVYERLWFEIEGLHFFRFYYESKDWFPIDLINSYDGIIINRNIIEDVSYQSEKQEIEILLEEDMSLLFSEDEFSKLFKSKNDKDITETISRLLDNDEIEFSGGHYYFINEKEYRTIMLYLKEQVNFLNKIYEDFHLRKIEWVE